MSWSANKEHNSFHNGVDSSFSLLDLNKLADKNGGPSNRPLRRPILMEDPQQKSAVSSKSTAVQPVVLKSLEQQENCSGKAAVNSSLTAKDILNEANEEAERIISEARQTARVMLAQARDVIAGEKAQAIDRGYREGRANGMAQADTEMASLIKTSEQIAIEISKERDRAYEDYESDLVQLAISIAKRIVDTSLEIDPDLVISVCRGAMRKAFQREHLQVLANPVDLERLRIAGPKLMQELGGIETLDFIEERRVDAGGVIVRAPAGEIDATIAGKAEKLEAAMKEEIEHRRNSG